MPLRHWDAITDTRPCLYITGINRKPNASLGDLLDLSPQPTLTYPLGIDDKSAGQAAEGHSAFFTSKSPFNITF